MPRLVQACPGHPRLSWVWQDVDRRDECSARGHSRRVFGDIADTFSARQVDDSDLVSGKEDPVLCTVCRGPDGQALAAKGLGDLPKASLEADVGLGRGDAAHDLVAVVFDLRQTIRHRSLARPISAGRDLLAERLMRPFEVVQRGLRTPTGPFLARLFIGIILGLVAEFAFMVPSTRMVLSSSAARWKSPKQIVGLKCRPGCSTGRHALGFWQLNRMSAPRHLRRSPCCSIWR